MGSVAVRYAKALLRLTEENGTSRKVSAEVSALLSGKISSPSAEIVEITRLLSQNGRIAELKDVLRSYLKQYYGLKGIHSARLKLARENKALEEKVKSVLEARTGGEVILESVVDEGLISGFLLEFDDYQLDASVKHQLDLIRKGLVVKENRII